MSKVQSPVIGVGLVDSYEPARTASQRTLDFGHWTLDFAAPDSYPTMVATKKTSEAKPTFFKTPADFQTWLAKNHDTSSELWVGFYKKDSGKASITWPESVDEALCVGWIDGIRKRVDEISYKIRFTPRRPGSVWSAVNIKRVAGLASEGRMQAAGEKAFAARLEYRSGIYAYEQRSPELPGPYSKKLKQNKAAWKFFESQPPSYRKLAMWWVVSAKQEETRLKRLQKLVDESAQGRRV